MKAIKKYRHQKTGEKLIFTIHGQRRKCEELLKLIETKMQRSIVWDEI